MKNEELVIAHMERARALAYHFESRSTFGHDYSEAESVAILALVKAGLNFQPSKGVPFWTFARPKVQGALIDAVRVRFGRFNRPSIVEANEATLADQTETTSHPDVELFRLHEALNELDIESYKLIMTWASTERRPTRSSSVEVAAFKELGMRSATFHLHKRRIIAQLRIKLLKRGVRKVSDIL